MTVSEAPASTSASYTPVVTDLSRLARVLFSPTAVFEEQQDKPTFWMPWLLISVLFGIVSFLMMPFQRRMMEAAAAAANRPAPPGWATMIGPIGSPLWVLIAVMIGTLFLWVLSMVMGGDTTFRRLMTVSIFCWPVVILQTAATAVVLRMRGLESINGPADMKVSLGLDLLLPADSTLPGFLQSVLGGIGPFEIWSLVISAAGLTVLAKMPNGKAWTAAIVAFVIGLVIRGAMGGMFGAG